MAAGDAMSNIGRTIGGAAAATGNTLNNSVTARLALGAVVGTAACAAFQRNGQRKAAAEEARRDAERQRPWILNDEQKLYVELHRAAKAADR